MQERIKALDRCGQFVGIGDACLLQTLRADIIGLGILKFAVGIVLAIFLRGRKTAHILIKAATVRFCSSSVSVSVSDFCFKNCNT